MPSMLFRSIRSLLPAKKAAMTSPKSPPRPKTQAFFLLACFFVLPFFSVCSSSAVMTRRFEGRSDALRAAAAGEGSREGSDDVSPPPKRRLRKDMTATRGARGVCRTSPFLSLSLGKQKRRAEIKALAHAKPKTSDSLDSVGRM
jgi:hypothetical protein